MTVDDVTKYKEECSGTIGRGQTVALHDGKFEGENGGFQITSGEFWGCGNINHYMVMNTDCRPMPDPDFSKCS